MANQKEQKQRSKPQSTCSDGKARIQKHQGSAYIIKDRPGPNRNEKISFDSADKLAEEIAALRDKKS